MSSFDESKHPRGADGRFGNTGAETVGEAALKKTGVLGGDLIKVLSTKVKKYAGFKTVQDFVDAHPKGRAHALRVLASDHKAGRIAFVSGDAKAGPVMAQDKTPPEMIPAEGTPERKFHNGMLEAAGSFGPQTTATIAYVNGKPRYLTVDTGNPNEGIARSFNLPDEGTRSATHTFFQLDNSKHGSGEAKAFLQKSVQAYAHLGIDEVKLHANIDVGGYAWLKYGFEPDANSKTFLANRTLGIARRLHASKAIDDATFAHIERNVGAGDFQAVSDLGGRSKTFTHNRKKVSLGQKLFLGSDWHGSLDLRSSAAVSRFNAYSMPKGS